MCTSSMSTISTPPSSGSEYCSASLSLSGLRYEALSGSGLGEALLVPGLVLELG